MTSVKAITFDASRQHGTALVCKDESVWIVYAPKWWDLASRLWWWLTPIDRKAFFTLDTAGGGKVRARAVRVARSHVRVNTSPGKR